MLDREFAADMAQPIGSQGVPQVLVLVEFHRLAGKASRRITKQRVRAMRQAHAFSADGGGYQRNSVSHGNEVLGLDTGSKANRRDEYAEALKRTSEVGHIAHELHSGMSSELRRNVVARNMDPGFRQTLED